MACQMPPSTPQSLTKKFLSSRSQVEFRGGGGGGGVVWTSLQQFLWHFTFETMSNVCLCISCHSITKGYPQITGPEMLQSKM